MHLLLKIVLHPTRSWNESWLPVLQSYPKSRSPCHLWTRGLKYHNSTRPPRHLAPIAAKVAHQGLPSDACSLLAGPLFESTWFCSWGADTQVLGLKGLPTNRNAFHTVSPLQTSWMENGYWEEGLELGRNYSLFSCGLPNRPCAEQISISSALLPTCLCVSLRVPVNTHTQEGTGRPKEGIYHSLPYSIETGPVTEPGASLAMNKPQGG